MQAFGLHGEDSPARWQFGALLPLQTSLALNMVLPYFWVACAKEIMRCGP